MDVYVADVCKKTGVWLDARCVRSRRAGTRVCLCEWLLNCNFEQICGLFYRHISKLGKQTWALLFDTHSFSLNVSDYRTRAHRTRHYIFYGRTPSPSSSSLCVIFCLETVHTARIEAFNSITVFWIILCKKALDTKALKLQKERAAEMG